MQTRTFPLVTGVQAEVSRMGGKEQKLLTQSEDNLGEGLYAVLKSITVKVGNVVIADLTSEEKDKFFRKMLTPDRKKLLIQSRQFTYDDDPDFSFTYKYKNKQGIEKEIQKEITLDDGFPEKKPLIFDSSLFEGKTWPEIKKMGTTLIEEVRGKLKPLTGNTYADIYPHKTITVPTPHGTTYKVDMSDGFGDIIAANTDEKDRSSHTPLLMRNIRRVDGKADISLRAYDLDKMSLPELETIRIALKLCEGQVDTEIMFENPVKGKPEVVTDIIGMMAFFFPSETI